MDYETLERKAYIEGNVERAALYALLDDQQRELLEGSYERVAMKEVGARATSRPRHKF